MRRFAILIACITLDLPTISTSRELSKKEKQQAVQQEEAAQVAKDAETKAKHGRDAFIATTAASIYICGFQGKLKAMEMPRLDTARAAASMEELAECTSKEKAKVAELYPDITKNLANKPEALKALKRYYAFWMSAMDAFLANVTEGSKVYEMVTNGNQQKLDDLYNQYKLELD